MASRHDQENSDRHMRSRAVVAVLAYISIMVATPSEAQRHNQSPRVSNVTIDYGVLDSLGPAPNLPRPPAGRAAATGKHIVLTPPSKGKAKRITVPLLKGLG